MSIPTQYSADVIGVPQTYGKRNIDQLLEGSDGSNKFVMRSGDSMMGSLRMLNGYTVTGLPLASIPGDAASKLYVDSALMAKLSASGGSMYGDITLQGGSTVTGVPLPLRASDVVSLSYTEAALQTKLSSNGGLMFGDIDLTNGSTVTGVPTPLRDSDAVPLSYISGIIAGAGGPFVKVIGDTMMGNLVMDNCTVTVQLPPVDDTDVANKKYVDDVVTTGYLPVVGGAMTGDLVMNNCTVIVPPPVDDTDVANKKYVDDVQQGYLPLTGGTLTGTLSVEGEGCFIRCEETAVLDDDCVNKLYVDTLIKPFTDRINPGYLVPIMLSATPIPPYVVTSSSIFSDSLGIYV